MPLDFVAAVALGLGAAVVFSAVGALALISHGLAQVAVLVALGLMFAAVVGLSGWSLYDRLNVPPHVDRRRDGSDVVLGTGLSAGTVLACLATLTALLVQHGAVPPHTGDGSVRLLGDLDRLYAWNALNMVPLLSVPTTLGWNEPDVVGGHLAGALVLIFKLASLQSSCALQ
jgi:hypothetical protein